MSACGKPPNTEAFSTWPVSSAWLAMPIRVFIGSREGVWTSELLMIGPVAPHHPGLDLARQHAHQRAAGATGGVGHVDMRIGAIARDDGGALDHGVGHLGVEIERHRDRHVGRDPADAIEQLAFAVVIVLGDHGAVQGQQHGVAALLDLLDDGRRHLLVGGLGHQTRGMGRGRHRHGEFSAGLARDFDEAAQGSVGAFGFLDGARTAQGAGAGERFDRGRQRRERIRLVHHHRDYKFLRQFSLPTSAKPLSNLQKCVQCADSSQLCTRCKPASRDRCALQKSHTQPRHKAELNM